MAGVRRNSTTMSHTITLTLTEIEEALIAALAHEHGLDEPADMLRTLLHDAAAVYDALWERSFAGSQAALDTLAEQAHAEYLAGLTEDFDTSLDPAAEAGFEPDAPSGPEGS